MPLNGGWLGSRGALGLAPPKRGFIWIGVKTNFYLQTGGILVGTVVSLLLWNFVSRALGFASPQTTVGFIGVDSWIGENNLFYF